MPNLNINYFSNKTDLCEIGKKYDTDKSSQRSNVTDKRHCHPYTLFYEGLFRSQKDDFLTIAELGILDGGSILMWREYFQNAQIYGFEYNEDLIRSFEEKFDQSRIHLDSIDVNDAKSIKKTFESFAQSFDLIIDDTTHLFEDQIRVVQNVHSFLKPGGLLIIEDIFKAYDENNYLKRLQPILVEFQDYYFVELDHKNKVSTGWNNDKLLVLVKGGAEPIFKNTNKLTIVTPSYRLDNLPDIKKSIDFNFVEEWIIVYDGTKIKTHPKLFEHAENGKIKEYIYHGPGVWGNGQRNYGLSKVKNKNTMLYFLDDDNIIHPNLYSLLNIVDHTKMYSFNQHKRLRGNNLRVHCIDTAMVLIPFSVCSHHQWSLDSRSADGYYIESCHRTCNDAHIFVDNELSYYNQL